MALAIATNNAALRAAASASSVNRDMETSMARLSTGKRINAARDDAAGVAIASRLAAEIRGTDQAIRNAIDGQALIDSAEGGHKEIENILQRMREVSVQAANDTNNTQDRSNLQAELNALITEIDRIASVTTWAGQKMMDSNGSSFSFQVGTATGAKNQIAVNLNAMDASSLDLKSVSTYVDPTTTAGTWTVQEVNGHTIGPGADLSGANLYNANLTGADLTDANLGSADLTNANLTGAYLSGATLTGADLNGAHLYNANLTGADLTNAYLGYANLTNAKIDADDWASLSSAQQSVAIKVAVASTASTASTASKKFLDAIKIIDTAIKTVNTQRSELGAISNRLSHTVNNLTNISANLSTAKGVIEDADFAHETSNLAKNQILQQASTAMLAQANASKQNVLTLLQG